MPLAWATAPTAGAVDLGRHLTGGRCRLAQALPLQERPPLQAVAQAAGCPLQPRSGQPPVATCLRALPTPAGASHACGRPQMLAAAPARGFGRGRPPPCRGHWPQPTLHGGWPWLAAPPRCLRYENTTITRRSYIPVFHIWMEKMKEVKRPPL
ncbi:hypothetical protein BHM03_00041563 [Ensete ventricosum]|nr:hypothetical protein BHM03_00041563 [Ensete ventricosum]